MLRNFGCHGYFKYYDNLQYMIYILLQYFGVNSFTFMHWILAVSITLLFLDAIFSQTEILSIIAIALFVDYLMGFLGNLIPVQWFVVLYVLLMMLALYLYATLWRKFVLSFFKKTLLRNASDESYEVMIGQKGVFRKIEGSEFVSWNGELWQIESPSSHAFQDGDAVFITGNKSGKLTIKKEG